MGKGELVAKVEISGKRKMRVNGKRGISGKKGKENRWEKGD